MTNRRYASIGMTRVIGSRVLSGFFCLGHKGRFHLWLEEGLVGVYEEKKLKYGMLVNGGQVFEDRVRFVVTLLEGFDDGDIETRWLQVKVPIGVIGVMREMEL